MSSVAAIAGRGSHRPTPHDIRALLAPGAYPGSRPRVALDGPCALAVNVLSVTSEDTPEDQPVVGGGLGVLAGRLDNREEVAAALGCVADGVSDAALAARAYRRWGVACPQRLVGAFALVVWDAERRVLFAATDHVGARPLYYAERSGTFFIASTIRQLRDGAGLGGGLDEAYMLARLAVPVAGPMHTTRTPYTGISRLLPGAAVLAEEGRPVRTWRYWRPEELPLGRGTVEEFGAALRERLEIAVRAQCRTRAKVMCTLSGGLDSSSITGLVARMARESTLPCRGFEAVSIVMEDPEGDERPYREAAERHFGVEAIQIPAAECGHYRDIGPGGLAPPVDEPFIHYGAYAETRQLALAAEKTGCAVVLFGHGGDELLAGTDYFVADLIRRGRFGDAARHLRGVARRPNRTYASAFADSVLHPVWAALRPDAPVVRRRRGVEPQGYRFEAVVPPWLPINRRRRRLIRDVYAEMTCVGTRPYARARDVDIIRCTGVAPVMNDCVFGPLGMEMRSPFLDRRVMELALATPAELRTAVVDAQRWTKLVLRAAMRDVLPAAITGRRTKAGFTSVAVDGVTSQWSRLANGGRFALADRGYVAAPALADALRASRMGYGDDDAHLPAAMVAELWLRSQA
nr:asparagine synthase-related protein [Micromonospora sp. DSM 115978]